ncbi:MAG: rhodanese-like domain-containing protein [Planctomycetota bacterium]
MASVDTPALAILTRSCDRVVLLDTREPSEGMETIPGARPLAPDCSESDAEAAIGSKEAPVVTFCTNIHCPLSMQLDRRLREPGYENVLEYQEGVDGWTAFTCRESGMSM